MLSILLPAYNTDVREIIYDLQAQAQLLSVDYEIICLDDHPQSKAFVANRELQTMGNVLLRRNRSNLGRAGNRNRLAQMARYPRLLYIDADSRIVASDYLEQYLEASQDARWIYGGTVYPAECPRGCTLHWSYGKHVEALDISTRQRTADFRSNNFVVDRELMLAYPMDESLVRYGHEDTLWAHHLDQADIAVKHIENPVLHHGLYDDATYLDRVEEACSHLAELTQRGVLPPITRLQRTDQRFDLPIIRQMVDGYLRARESSLRESLLSSAANKLSRAQETRRKQMPTRHERSLLSRLAWYKWAIYARSLRD